MEDTTIEVWIAPSEYGCCGVPFAVGDEIGFTLVRFVDAGGDQYWDDRHPTDDAPGVDVHGRVEAIVAAYERMVPVAGTHQLTNDPNDTIERIVDAVPTTSEPDGYAQTIYRVTFRVPIDAELPAPRRPFPEPEPYVLPRPERTILLTQLVDEVEQRFGDAVVILRARDDTAVTLAPAREDAASVRWNLYSDELVVEIERAEWRLPWPGDALPVLRQLIDAAATGGFSETVENAEFVSIARTPNGIPLTATAAAPVFPEGGGPIVITGPVAERLTRFRSGRPFPPW
ncbi:hypothetical protein KNO15_06860 [Leifsonia shinshuensis]|uniref:DUF6578 domain-containing protein n=1 Tax=Leifsonia shinshuensis TaxID=150026 RepID=UPI001F51128F|nr:DUF6578 domain-containing protein [Leifsonia shinshuensis]MCI0156412.1 hypothetical protein [Leifsonia shinshuensis]